MAGRRAYVLSEGMGCHSNLPTIATSECDLGLPQPLLFKRKPELSSWIFHFVNFAGGFYFKAFFQPNKIHLSWVVHLWPSLKKLKANLALNTHNSICFRVIWVAVPKCPPCFDALQVLTLPHSHSDPFYKGWSGEQVIESQGWSLRLEDLLQCLASPCRI